MTDINPSQLIAQLRSMASAAAGAPAETAAGGQTDFSEILARAVNGVNDSQQESNALKVAFQRGDEGIDISRVMIASQKASIEFQLMIQVRNKLVSAYQDIMNMQI